MVSGDQGSHLSSLRIDASHPSLPGHFPGHPIVPGVLLLDQVLSRAEQWLGTRLRIETLTQAKFVQPLLPNEEATLSIAYAAPELKFEIYRGSHRIAQGSFKSRLGSDE
jgi:3-hydroxymyristoyl/3-hydroxydecanoyl-(acyl carrier protein) dehydratase